MLYALAIYTYDQFSGEKKLSMLAQQETIQKNLPNALKDVEAHTLPKYAYDLDEEIYYKNNKLIYEHHYVKRNENYRIILVIVSRNKLHPVNAITLFNNMTYIYRNLNKKDITLSHLLENEFLTQELVIAEIHKTNKETLEINRHNMSLTLERGETLFNLANKTTVMKNDSIELKDNSKKLDKCCRPWN